MAGTNILKEFLVKIGFKVDEQKFRNFQEAMRVTAKNAMEMGKTTLAASTVMGTSLKLIGQQMEGLYYAAQRTGASAAHLKEFSFAASQVGVSAEQAQNAIEGLAAARRTNPGLNGILGGMGIDPRQLDNSKVMIELLGKLHSMPFYQGSQIAGMFGIDQGTFLMLEQGLPQMQKFLALREKMFGVAGINPSDMTARSHEFMTQFRTLEAGVGNLADIMAYRLMPAGERVIGWLENVVEWLTKADKATDGWSSKILGVLTALAGGSIVKGGFGLLGKMFGGAAGGEAAGGGASLLSIPVIAAAALAALGYIVASKSAAHGIAKALGLPDRITGDTLKGWAGSAWHATGIPAAAKSLHQQAQDSGGYAKALSAQPGMLGDLARMIVAHEGFRNRAYKDIAGLGTIGVGHLIRPGEDFSKGLSNSGVMALLGKDIQSAIEGVKRRVKTHLSQNQTEALADFVFSLGEGNFAKSTLLKKLNSGDFAGAADQFQHWNKAMVNGHLVSNRHLSDIRAAEERLFRTPDSAVTLNQHTEIHVDSNNTAQEVARQQGRVNGDLVRNFATAVQ